MQLIFFYNRYINHFMNIILIAGVLLHILLLGIVPLGSILSMSFHCVMFPINCVMYVFNFIINMILSHQLITLMLVVIAAIAVVIDQLIIV